MLALVGGRNYGVSQLNHALAERPTGSIFKPFVYAAAYNTSLNGTNLNGSGPFNALTLLNDDPTTFTYDGKAYTPGNFERGEYPGMVTAVAAIAHSLNIATINLAQMVGFDNVASLARQSGIVNARGTPSVAIGTYNATPLDMAGAYTVFANNGVHLKPWMLASVRNPNGDIIADYAPEAKQVLDPRVAYLTQSLLEDVMTYRHGFRGAQGRIHRTRRRQDRNLARRVVRRLLVESPLRHLGRQRRLHRHLARPYACAARRRCRRADLGRVHEPRDQASAVLRHEAVQSAPDGVEVLRIDRATNLPADAACPSDGFTVAFLVGTAPQGTCSHMGEDSQTLANRLFNPDAVPDNSGNPNNPDDATKHRNFFQKMFGLGKDKDKQQQQQQPQQPQQPQHSRPTPQDLAAPQSTAGTMDTSTSTARRFPAFASR